MADQQIDENERLYNLRLNRYDQFLLGNLYYQLRGLAGMVDLVVEELEESAVADGPNKELTEFDPLMAINKCSPSLELIEWLEQFTKEVRSGSTDSSPDPSVPQG